MMRDVLRTVLLVALAVPLANLAGTPSMAWAQANPDDLIAFERRVEGGDPEIRIMDVDGSDQRRLVQGCCNSWAPDGITLAFIQGEHLYIIRRDGTGLRRLVSGIPAGDVLAWSPDGKQLAFCGFHGEMATAIYVVNVDGTGLGRLTSPRGPIEDSHPAWSPDGTQIAFQRDNYAGDDYRVSVIVMSADGTTQRVLTPKSIEARRPSWSYDGLRIAFEGGLGPRKGDIYVMSRDGSNQVNLTRTKSPDDQVPQFSSDGSTIVFESYTKGPGKLEIHRIDADGTKHLNLTRNGGRDSDPEWTPDGRILFVSDRDGNRDVYIMRAGGGGVTNLTNTTTRVGNTRPAWSP